MLKPKILISGAGIAGLTLARQLKKFNIPFRLIEKRPVLSTEGAGIALPANGVKAVRYLGLGEKIEKRAHRVNKVIYADSTGVILNESSLLEPPLNNDWFVALRRNTFQAILCEGLENSIDFNTSISALRASENGVRVTFQGAEENTEEFSAVIGADGVHSRVRALAFSKPPLTDLGITIWRWLCKYPTADLEPLYMFSLHDVYMAYPIGNNEVYCYAHVLDPDNVYSQKTNPRAFLAERFAEYGGVAKQLFSLLPPDQFIIAGRLCSISQPHFIQGAAALIGDASHVCATLLQQGAACAMEDAIVLAELLHHFPVEKALAAYKQFRQERVSWIIASSDGPTKALIKIEPGMMPELYKKIQENGPLNVQGWKKLLITDPLQELPLYIENIKRS